MYSMVYNGSLQSEFGSNLDQLGQNLTHHVKSQVFATKVNASKDIKKTHFYFNLISTTGAQPVKSILIFTLRQILGSLRFSPISSDFVISSSWFPKHAEPMLPVITRMLPTKRCLHSASTNLASRHQLPWCKTPEVSEIREMNMLRWNIAKNFWKFAHFDAFLHIFCHLVNFSLRMKGAKRAFQTTSRPQMRDSFTWFPVKYE